MRIRNKIWCSAMNSEMLSDMSVNRRHIIWLPFSFLVIITFLKLLSANFRYPVLAFGGDVAVWYRSSLHSAEGHDVQP